MKVILILGFIAYASAGLYAPQGTSTVSRSQDALGNYAFSYDENHQTGGTFRRESGNPGGVTGSYGLRDMDGRLRIVSYVADGAGFRASVQTNEPGTDAKESAAVSKAPLAAPLLPAIPAPIAAPISRIHYGPVLPAAPLVAAPFVPAPVVPGPVIGSFAPGSFIANDLNGNFKMEVKH